MNKEKYIELNFAKIDINRQKRCGYGEVIYCKSKKNDDLLKIFQTLNNENQNILGTKADEHQAEFLKKYFKKINYDKTAKTITLINKPIEQIGKISICTAGTSDIPVALEAKNTAEFFGSKVELYNDIGVAGLHRLLANIEKIKQANVIIVTAGMDGALPSVITGLVDIPVIALPTSIGYGASFNGLSALLGMLNSCAEGISVVNIDNGFGAGYSANQINRLIAKGNRIK